MVVFLTEAVEQGVELFEGGRLLGLVPEPFLEGLLEAFDLALGLGMVPASVLLGHAQCGQGVFEGVAAAADSDGGVADV